MIMLRSACAALARRSPGASRRAATLASLVLFLPGTTLARPGIHPVVVSSWDTRASSVALEYRHGFMKGGGFNDVGYVAAFSSTTGKLSAQFGLHYVNLAEESETTVHGISGTATALFSLPLTQRLDNGLAKAALGLYFGSAPTIMSSGARNFLSIPLVLGVGVPLTPARAITITPWGELSPGVNLDTQINSFQFSEDEARDLVDPVTNEVKLTEAQVEAIVSDSVELDASATGGLRGGIDLALHVSNAVDFEVNVTLSSLGSALLGPTVTYVGGGIVYRWDDIVPAVLPAEKRLLKEDCDAIEERFRTCPNSRRWQPPRDLTIEPQPAPPPQPAPAAPPPRPPTSTAPPAAAPPPAPAAPPPIPAPAPAPPAAAPAPTPAPAPAPPSTKAFPP